MIKNPKIMKTATAIIAIFTGILLITSCGSKNYNNQPWMPQKGKAKHHNVPGHHNKAHSYHQSTERF
jgi:hypothetical protein